MHREEGTARCLDDAQVAELAGYLKRAEALLGAPAEIEWAMDAKADGSGGIKMLQARPLAVMAASPTDETWARRPGLRGHPAGVGWGAGRACVVNCECELGRVAPGDVLVTRVAGPSLGHILPHVAGVVAELGGSTSHLASLARERGIPMVLGVHDATLNIPDGAKVAVDGVAGIVRWMEG
jgi:pyruvate,water dikinase